MSCNVHIAFFGLTHYEFYFADVVVMNAWLPDLKTVYDIHDPE